jgi:hypothetical protein
MLAGTTHAMAMRSAIEAGPAPVMSDAISGPAKLAQTQPAPAPAQAPAPAAAPSPAPAAAAEPIGNVATLTGSATVTRNNASTLLQLKDDIFENDVLQTAANSTLGVTFNDATTFHLTANSQITVDFFVYEDGGQKNGALFDIAKGAVAFVAAAVAKTGDMRISTPTATLGIRGTTGLIEVPEDASATRANNVAIKLYPDPDGRVGQIEVNSRDGIRLGSLTQAASGFAIRPGAGGRVTAQPLVISASEVRRDQGIVRQVHAAQSVGRQIVTERRLQRQQNPPGNRPGNNPAANPARQPGLPKQNGLPQRPGAPAQPGRPNRAGQQGQPPQAPGLPRPPNTPGLRQGGPQKPDALPQQPALPNRAGEQSQPPQAPGQQRQPGAPGVRQGGLQNKPALPKRPPAGPAPKRKPDERR